MVFKPQTIVITNPEPWLFHFTFVARTRWDRLKLACLCLGKLWAILTKGSYRYEIVFNSESQDPSPSVEGEPITERSPNDVTK